MAPFTLIVHHGRPIAVDFAHAMRVGVHDLERRSASRSSRTVAI
jgi:hypothetical protein